MDNNQYIYQRLKQIETLKYSYCHNETLRQKEYCIKLFYEEWILKINQQKLCSK